MVIVVGKRIAGQNRLQRRDTSLDRLFAHVVHLRGTHRTAARREREVLPVGFFFIRAVIEVLNIVFVERVTGVHIDLACLVEYRVTVTGFAAIEH